MSAFSFTYYLEDEQIIIIIVISISYRNTGLGLSPKTIYGESYWGIYSSEMFLELYLCIGLYSYGENFIKQVQGTNRCIYAEWERERESERENTM